MRLVILIISFAISFAQSFSQDKENFQIKINNLDELNNSKLFNSSVYLLGTVNPQPDSLYFNGSKALLENNGAFLAFTRLIQLEESKINTPTKSSIVIDFYRNGNAYTTKETLYVYLPTNNFSENSIEIDGGWNITPTGEYIISSGDRINIEFRATPHCTASFTFGNDSIYYPLQENSVTMDYYWGETVFGSGLNIPDPDTLKGIYKGSFIMPDYPDSISIGVILKHNKFGRKTFTLPVKIKSAKEESPIIAVTKYDPNLITARYGPRKGYKLFLQEGIKLKVSAIENGWLKSDLDDNNRIYVPLNSVNLLPGVTTLPNAEIQVIRIENNETIDVKFHFDERVPVEIRQYNSPAKYEIIFYNVTANIDWVVFDKSNEFIDKLEHYQIGANTLKVDFTLKMKSHWGFSSVYEGNTFILKIKKPPVTESGFIFASNPLKGKVISIDPGHSPETGAVGPTGLMEKDINFVLSKKLERELIENGAKAYLTRDKNEALPLRNRRSRVVSFTPDVSISMHNNAVPQSVNPLKQNGFSVYYYYNQAKPLAELIHKEFTKNLEIPNFGIYWDNLYMCRITETVSILVEPAFIIHPHQERLLKTDSFQNKIVESIVEALKTFFEDYQE